MFRRLSTVPRNRTTLLSTLLVPGQNESVSIVRRLPKNRYISTKRNKTTFFSIQIPELPFSSVGLCQASTVGSVSSPQAPASAHPASFLDVKIPIISQSDPQPLVQIPYVPDFWDSSSSPIEPVSKDILPKLLVVAGAETHHGGGPSHNLLDISSGSLGSVITDSSSGSPKGKGLWDDMADDVGLPPTKDVKKAIWKFFS